MVYPIYLVLVFLGLSHGQIITAAGQKVAAEKKQKLTVTNKLNEAFKYEIFYAGHKEKKVTHGTIAGMQTIKIELPIIPELELHMTIKGSVGEITRALWGGEANIDLALNQHS
ncbi:MAG TPA: hypothetical protein VLG71_00230 [Candidatus Limnocylindria bacterium]|nr:hypothetical protein [Candidatus Limnocylindria bacterium]